MKRLALLAVCMLAGVSLYAKVTMPSVFGDNMVLQRNSEVALWGKASPDARVNINASWSKTRTTVMADASGAWKATIATPGAGGPYSLTVSDGESLTFRNILTGEVWLCSGQSNMEMPICGFSGQWVDGGADAIASANAQTPIRICDVAKNSTREVLDDCKAKWSENVPEAVAQTSAVAYFYAQYLQKALDVPVGIIVSAYGGTKIETWMSEELLKTRFPGEYDLESMYADPSITSRMKPCCHYNSMIAPIAPYTLKGMIWYQGESNRGDPGKYARLQPEFISMMRELWQNPDMPFYFVQIAPYKYSNPDSTDGAMLMESQAKTLDMVPHTGMAITADIGDSTCIHPAKKKEVGLRLALMALKTDYGIGLKGAYAPLFDKVEFFSDGKAIVRFKNVDAGLGPVNASIPGFEVAGEDRVFHKVRAKVENNNVVILQGCPEVPSPVAVRYLFHNCHLGVLRNGLGIPAAPFRTDDWTSEK